MFAFGIVGLCWYFACWFNLFVVFVFIVFVLVLVFACCFVCFKLIVLGCVGDCFLMGFKRALGFAFEERFVVVEGAVDCLLLSIDLTCVCTLSFCLCFMGVLFAFGLATLWVGFVLNYCLLHVLCYYLDSCYLVWCFNFMLILLWLMSCLFKVLRVVFCLLFDLLCIYDVIYIDYCFWC